MDTFLPSSQAELQFAWSLGCLTLGFIAYHFLAHAPSWYERFFKGLAQRYDATASRYVSQRYTGVLFLGVLPLLVYFLAMQPSAQEIGLGFNLHPHAKFWVPGLWVVIFIVHFLHARQPDHLSVYPQIRFKQWDLRLLLVNSLSWLAYMTAYEVLFRGILLFGTLPLLGAPGAILLNMALYSLTHIPKGLKETLGALPVGFLFCSITLYTGSIWIALLVHGMLAVANDVFALYFQPEMRFEATRKTTS